MFKIVGFGSRSGWIWNFFLDPDPELLKNRSWILNKSSRIMNTELGVHRYNIYSILLNNCGSFSFVISPL